MSDGFDEIVYRDMELAQLDLDMEDIIQATESQKDKDTANVAAKALDVMFSLDMLLTFLDIDLAKKFFLATNSILEEIGNRWPENPKDMR